MSGRSRNLGFFATAGAALVVGALLLKGFAGEGPDNPVASVSNGHPRGLLALARWWEARHGGVVVRTSYADPIPDGVLLVPPPEVGIWNEPETRALLTRVEQGDLDVIVLCDDHAARNRGLKTLVSAAGVTCKGEGSAAVVTSRVPGWPETLSFRGPGGLELNAGSTAVPVYGDDEGPQVVAAPHGRGRVWVVASASAFTNDGLATRDNAAVLDALVGGRPLTIEEAHHHVRRGEVLAAAFGRPGPQVGLLALLLLLPLSWLALVPRPGDAPTPDLRPRLPAAEAAARALAALFVRAGLADDAGEE